MKPIDYLLIKINETEQEILALNQEISALVAAGKITELSSVVDELTEATKFINHLYEKVEDWNEALRLQQEVSEFVNALKKAD